MHETEVIQAYCRSPFLFYTITNGLESTNFCALRLHYDELRLPVEVGEGGIGDLQPCEVPLPELGPVGGDLGVVAEAQKEE